MDKNYQKGLIFALVTAFISGFSIFYNKLIVTSDIDPLVFNIVKNGGVAIILSFIIIFFKKKNDILSLNSSQKTKLFLISLIGGSIPFLLFFQGLKTSSAINASLIHKTLFIWVAVITIPLLKEKLNKWQIIGYFIVFLSNFFLGNPLFNKIGTGEALILAATLLWALENVIAKNVLKTVDAQVTAWSRMFFGSLVLIIIAVINRKILLLFQINPQHLSAIFISIILLTGYVLSWYQSLKLAPATAVTSVLILSTPITNILSAIFISGYLPKMHLVNFVTSLIGVYLISLITSKIGKKSTS